jgi:hypothetical protein
VSHHHVIIYAGLRKICLFRQNQGMSVNVTERCLLGLFSLG